MAWRTSKTSWKFLPEATFSISGQIVRRPKMEWKISIIKITWNSETGFLGESSCVQGFLQNEQSNTLCVKLKDGVCSRVQNEVNLSETFRTNTRWISQTRQNDNSEKQRLTQYWDTQCYFEHSPKFWADSHRIGCQDFSSTKHTWTQGAEKFCCDHIRLLDNIWSLGPLLFCLQFQETSGWRWWNSPRISVANKTWKGTAIVSIHFSRQFILCDTRTFARCGSNEKLGHSEEVWATAWCQNTIRTSALRLQNIVWVSGQWVCFCAKTFSDQFLNKKLENFTQKHTAKVDKFQCQWPGRSIPGYPNVEFCKGAR